MFLDLSALTVPDLKKEIKSHLISSPSMDMFYPGTLEMKAQIITIGDLSFQNKLIKYQKNHGPDVAKSTTDLWAQYAEVITIDTTEKAIKTGKIPAGWKEAWTDQTRDYVEGDLTAEWLASIKESGDDVEDDVNKIRVKAFDFNTGSTSVKGWVDQQGGTLIVDLSATQYNSMKALLQHQIALGVTSPAILAERMSFLVGLTEGEMLAVTRSMSAMIEEGLSPAIIEKQTIRYANILHKNRLDRIARTELSDSYNFGHLDSLKQAEAEGWLPGIPEKGWMTRGKGVLDICKENEAIGYIALDAEFPSGHQHPTEHPNCKCSLRSRIRREN